MYDEDCFQSQAFHKFKHLGLSLHKHSSAKPSSTSLTGADSHKFLYLQLSQILESQNSTSHPLVFLISYPTIETQTVFRASVSIWWAPSSSFWPLLLLPPPLHLQIPHESKNDLLPFLSVHSSHAGPTRIYVEYLKKNENL